MARLEQQLMLGFYAIRKLGESAKLSDATLKRQVTLTAYPSVGRPVTRMNWDKIDELYDFAAPQIVVRDLPFVCNQLIHSYVFTTGRFDNDNLFSIMFTSDRERKKSLYSMEIDDVIDFFETVGRDYPACASFKFNEEKQDYDIRQW